MSADSFEECHLVDLAQRGKAEQHFLDGRLAQEPHPLFMSRLLDLGCGATIQDHLTDAIGQVQQLTDRRSAFEPRSAALDAARTFEELTRCPEGGVQAGLLERRRLDTNRTPAVRADEADQPLRHHTVECGDELVWLDS